MARRSQSIVGPGQKPFKVKASVLAGEGEGVDGPVAGGHQRPRAAVHCDAAGHHVIDEE